MISDGYMITPLLSTASRHRGTDLLSCCTNELELEEAKANLRKSFVVGVLEDMHKFQTVLHCLLWWYTSFEIERINTSPKLSTFEKVRQPFWAFATSLDQQIYEYAKLLLEVDYELCTGYREKEKVKRRDGLG